MACALVLLAVDDSPDARLPFTKKFIHKSATGSVPGPQHTITGAHFQRMSYGMNIRVALCSSNESGLHFSTFRAAAILQKWVASWVLFGNFGSITGGLP